MTRLTLAFALVAFGLQVSCGATSGDKRGVDSLVRGLGFADSGKYREAIRSFRTGLLTDAHQAACNNIGVSYARLGDYERALLEYNRVPRKCRSAVLQYNRGVALLRLKRHVEAEQALRDVIASFPRFPKAWNNLGLALLGQRRYKAAEWAVRRALAIRVRSPRAWNNLGAVHARSGRVGDAVRAYREALRLDPGFSLARRNIARLSRGSAR